MQIKETLSQNLKREFEVNIPSSEIEKKLIRHLETLGKKVKIPGFRTGKVPLNILKQRYTTEVRSEVLKDCVDEAIKQIVKEKNIKPALQPQVNIKSYEEEKDLELEVKMEILPTIGEINLDNLSFEKYVVSVPPESISRIIEDIAKKSRETRPIQKVRKTQKGDIVIIDFEGYIEDSPIEEGSGKDHPLELGSGSFIPGFEDQLIGHHKGTDVKVNVTFPDEYHEKKYASQPARFDVNIKDIHESDPIVIDAALATKLGFETLENMQEAVEKNISKIYTTHSFMNIKRHVLDALSERFHFETPENMVEIEFKNIWQQLLHELGISLKGSANTNVESGISEKSFAELAGKSEEELKKEYKTIAERRVRLGLLLAEIGNRNNIAISNQELLNALIAKAKEFPGQEKEVFEFYRNNESAMASLRAPLFEDKVVNFILDKATLTEKKVTPEELEKLLAVEEEEAEKQVEIATKEADKKMKAETKKTKPASKKKDS